ncbi:MAG TPA: hypothetical protein VNX40_12940 [Mucilaginibacter sp.]|nr:hypothetical protein [Mucilaginibacter sp.]
MIKKILAPSLLILFLLPCFGRAQIKLVRRSLLNGKVEILVPDYFKQMSADMIAVKYPNAGQHPDAVFTDANAEVNLVISQTGQPIQPDQIGQYKDFMIATLKHARPDAVWLDNGIKTINGKQVGYFKMMTAAVDQKVFVYYFFTSLDGKVLLFTFNCTQKLLPKWKTTADAIVASLKVK